MADWARTRARVVSSFNTIADLYQEEYRDKLE
jgi:hypothetical protein